MISAPAAWKARAMATDSSGVTPSSVQSVAEMRTDMGLSSGQTARMAVNTSSGQRRRLASDSLPGLAIGPTGRPASA